MCLGAVAVFLPVCAPPPELAAVYQQSAGGIRSHLVAQNFMNRTCSLWFVCAVSIVAASCHASYPAAPTDATPVAFQIYYTNPVGLASVGSSYRFDAYTLRADGAYEDVSTAATWSSSDPSTLRPGVVTFGASTGSPLFSAAAPGAADVTANYQGLSSSLPMFVIRSDRRVYPFLTIAMPSVLSWTAGRQGQAAARVERTATARDVVTDLARWSSSNSEVLTVQQGLLTAVAPGTAHITVSYEGLSAFVGVSVHPRRQAQ
jgi:hypothetical protein